MSFDIAIDYRFDRLGFFDDPEARAALERAAEIWEARIRDGFEAVPAGVSFTVRDPSDRSTDRRVTLAEPVDDLVLFVGGAELSSVLAVAGPAGLDAPGDALQARVSRDFRGTGPATDFEPFAGSVSFSTVAEWSFDLAGPVKGRSDFLTTAVHEIAHVLGFGTSGAFEKLVSNERFTGPNAVAANGGEPVPMAGTQHIGEDFADGATLMDPFSEVGERRLPGAVDLAMLADIGYEIDGFARQGAQPAVTGEGDDRPLFGTDAGDRIAALGGNDLVLGGEGPDTVEAGAGDDEVQGGPGDDLLAGGPGSDRLFGGPGTDIFAFAPGDGAAEVADFAFGQETLLLSPAFGLDGPEAVLARASLVFSNVTRLDLGGGTTVDLFHEDAAATPLTSRDIAFGVATPVVAGTPGPDGLAGSAASERFEGLAGDDLLAGSAGSDTLEGGEGIDRAAYAFARADTQPERRPDGTVTLPKPGGGTDTLTAVERIDLADGDFLYDLEGPDTGFAYRVYATVYARTPDEGGLRFWVEALAAGLARDALAQAFVATPEFERLFGRDTSDAVYVEALYENALGRAPDPAGAAYWIDAFGSGALDRADMLAAFADAPETRTLTAPDLDDGVFVLADPFPEIG